MDGQSDSGGNVRAGRSSVRKGSTIADAANAHGLAWAELDRHLTSNDVQAQEDAQRRERRDLDLVLGVRMGRRLRDIGASHGLSGERVRQIVRRLDPDAFEAGRALRPARTGPEAREVTCAICGRPFQTTNRRRKTCTGVLAGPIIAEMGSEVHAGEHIHEVERHEPLFISPGTEALIVEPSGKATLHRGTEGTSMFIQAETCSDIHRRGWATPELRERRNTRTAKHIVDAERASPGRYPTANVRWAEKFLGARDLLP